MFNNGEMLARVIMEDAFQEAEAILEKAEKEAASIREESLKKLAEARRQAETDAPGFSQSRSDMFLGKAKMISQAELQARMELIYQKESVLEGVLQTIRQELFSLPGHPDYPGLMKKLILQGLKWLEQAGDLEQAGGDEFVCQVNDRDRPCLPSSLMEELGRKSGKKVSLGEQHTEIEGGVIVWRSDGRVLYDNSLEAIFDRWEEAMRSMAARLFFEK